MGSVSLRHLLSVVAFRVVSVVSSTRELDITNTVVTTTAKRLSVVELEPFGFGAAAAVGINVCALTAVSLMHGPFDRSRNVA
jgi:hypothetical protein